MAVAVQSSETKNSSQPMGLVAASIAGAIYVLVAAAVVLRIVPMLWDKGGHEAISGASNSFVSTALRFVVQIGAAIGLIWAGSKLASGPKAVGVRGGIALMIGVVLVGFFCIKGLLDTAGKGFSAGTILLMLVYAVIIFLIVQMFRTNRFATWAIVVDQGGWLDTHTHKRTQGLRARRLTMLGLLIMASTGIWTLVKHDYLPTNTRVKLPNGEEVDNRLGDWVIGGKYLPIETADKDATPAVREAIAIENRSRPRIDGGITLLPDLQYTIPMLLTALSLWLIWRIVNYPVFADFLIATDAEINKVSWTTRKALIRDTIVVLTSLVLLTVFLFVVDMFWNTLLSSNLIGVLPTEEERAKAVSKQDARPVTEW